MEYHLRELEEELHRRGWRITAVGPAEPPQVSGRWFLQRGSVRLDLVFEGLAELAAAPLPLERAYACHVAQRPELSLYFARKGRSWAPETVAGFVRQLALVDHSGQL